MFTHAHTSGLECLAAFRSLSPVFRDEDGHRPSSVQCDVRNRYFLLLLSKTPSRNGVKMQVWVAGHRRLLRVLPQICHSVAQNSTKTASYVLRANDDSCADMLRSEGPQIYCRLPGQTDGVSVR